jgi:hypothetical protein
MDGLATSGIDSNGILVPPPTVANVGPLPSE